MTYKSLFIDSDILLDLLLNREPFSHYVQLLLFESEKRNIKLYTSALVISNIHYVLSKYIGAASSKSRIKELIKVINVLSVENGIIALALDSYIADFEDAVQYLIAQRYNLDGIITRNIKDYKKSIIPILTASDFLKTL